jgi:hypothetical protein
MTKFLLFSLFLLAFVPAAHAQMGFNSPTGVTPFQDIEMYSRNGFLVQQKYRITTDIPESSVNNLSCFSTPTSLTAQAGILKDPNGNANYNIGVSYSCTQAIVPTPSIFVIGIELVFTDFNTEVSRDFVYILNESQQVLYTFSGNSIPQRLLVPGQVLYIRFVTNNNNVAGRGFELRWRALVSESVGSPPPNAVGNFMQFNTYRGSLVAGNKNRADEFYSTALGYDNNAGSFASTAIGFINSVQGDYSVAIGKENKISSSYGVAIGRGNIAGGIGSMAIGTENIADEIGAIAFGKENTASGVNSTAMGYRMNTNLQAGAFMIGDSDPLGQGTTGAGATDQFVARFRNGYYLMTSGTVTRTGVVIGAGQNAWSAISDSTRKERFVPMNHTEVLRKINAMHLTSWNYKGQREIRHYGPMAQDFYAAFGHDALGPIGCDTLINSHDFAGVTFAGVQALIRENDQLKTRLNAVENENARLRVETQDFASQLQDSRTETQNFYRTKCRIAFTCSNAPC